MERFALSDSLVINQRRACAIVTVSLWTFGPTARPIKRWMDNWNAAHALIVIAGVSVPVGVMMYLHTFN